MLLDEVDGTEHAAGSEDDCGIFVYKFITQCVHAIMVWEDYARNAIRSGHDVITFQNESPFDLDPVSRARGRPLLHEP